ncbi:unnamed protein product [Gongylonema pulchrum]|uniref:F-box domain-containing protein n=1 Tax=Gongylonema pulchrum TaxID=637853 RepID=A0A183F0Y0_9BILA|nr:unnamed protein product [Gongylonema pulchrum]
MSCPTNNSLASIFRIRARLLLRDRVRRMSGDDGGGPSKKRRIDKELTRMLRLREELQAPDQEPESQRTEEQQQQQQQTMTRRRLRHRLPEQQRWHPSNFAELSLVTGYFREFLFKNNNMRFFG